MITAAQASEYLDKALGISAPAFIVDAAISKVAAAEAAMTTAVYSAGTMVLIQSYAVAIIAAAGAPRRIASQGAPSGASRSFKNSDNTLSMLRRSLTALDPAGTATALIGPDQAGQTMFIVTC